MPLKEADVLCFLACIVTCLSFYFFLINTHVRQHSSVRAVERSGMSSFPFKSVSKACGGMQRSAGCLCSHFIPRRGAAVKTGDSLMAASCSWWFGLFFHLNFLVTGLFIFWAFDQRIPSIHPFNRPSIHPFIVYAATSIVLLDPGCHCTPDSRLS